MAMVTPASGSRSDILDNAQVTSHLLQPDALAGLSHPLPEYIDLDKILPDFYFAGMDSVDFTALVPAFAFKQILAHSEPLKSLT
jgi:hypothetical protein